MEQNRRKTKLSRAQVRRLVIGAAIAAVVITAGAVYLRKRVTEQFGRGSTAEISSAEVISGSISTSVYGSGRLSDDDVEKLEIPSGVKLKEIRVSPGDKVDESTLLASVNVNSVLAAMNDVSDQLSTLDSSISAAASSSGVSYISASVSGRIKKIYAAAGDSVSGVMYEHGALMLLSLDGYMAVDIDAPSLSAGDSVTITEDGSVMVNGAIQNEEVVNATVPGDGLEYPYTDDTHTWVDAKAVQQFAEYLFGATKEHLDWEVYLEPRYYDAERDAYRDIHYEDGYPNYITIARSGLVSYTENEDGTFTIELVMEADSDWNEYCYSPVIITADYSSGHLVLVSGTVKDMLSEAELSLTQQRLEYERRNPTGRR